MTTLAPRRLFELFEPVALVTYMAAEPTDELLALGLRNPARVGDRHARGCHRSAPTRLGSAFAVCDALDPDEMDELVQDLEPLAAVLVASGSR